MSTNTTVFLAYAPVGRNTKAFQAKKIVDKKEERQARTNPAP
jgi:hypothetical protein